MAEIQELYCWDGWYMYMNLNIYCTVSHRYNTHIFKEAIYYDILEAKNGSPLTNSSIFVWNSSLVIGLSKSQTGFLTTYST
jgi:hypothetical protein